MLPQLINNILKCQFFDHAVENSRVIETHISWILLTGEYAYKIKKPVNLGFVDFSDLTKRKYYCEEELRLNQRLAPEIYLAVVAIYGSATHPVLDAEGEAIEYMVKMRQFDSNAQYDCLLEQHTLTINHLKETAERIADFHRDIQVADPESTYGTSEQIYQSMLDNIIQIRAYNNNSEYKPELNMLETQLQNNIERYRPFIQKRRTQGFVRECHGDLHLANLAWVNDKPLAFDCLEFSAELRFVDVINEIAFLVMDLQSREQPSLAFAFLNQYLESSGDYEGVTLLNFYLIYRALVRAKVGVIQSQQGNAKNEQATEQKESWQRYLALAKRYSQPIDPVIIITRGLSGSGKTTCTNSLMLELPAIRVRSDVERKRLNHMGATQSSTSSPNSGLYTKEMSDKTYQRLQTLTSSIIHSGYSVIIDAANLEYDRRQPFHALSKQLQVPLIILQFNAASETLEKRIISRKNDASDATLAVLKHQLEHWQPVHEEEKHQLIEVDTEQSLDTKNIVKVINARMSAFTTESAN